MSRIGNNPVELPDGVSLEVAGLVVTAKGKLGELSARLTDDVEITQQDNVVTVKPRPDAPNAKKMWGTSRSVIANLVAGVSEGFVKKLEIISDEAEAVALDLAGGKVMTPQEQQQMMWDQGTVSVWDLEAVENQAEENGQVAVWSEEGQKSIAQEEEMRRRSAQQQMGGDGSGGGLLK